MQLMIVAALVFPQGKIQQLDLKIKLKNVLCSTINIMTFVLALIIGSTLST